MSKILIIDDDKNLRETLSDILELKGYDTIIAINGADGIAKASDEEIDVALIDLSLPDLSGMEVLKKIKNDHPLIEAIVLTGNASLSSAIESTNKGVISYIEKPCNTDDLLFHISHAIEKKNSHERINRNLAIQYTINLILQKALEPISQIKLFEEILDIIILCQWFSLEPMGCIHLADHERESLIFAAQRGFPETFNTHCSEVPN